MVTLAQNIGKDWDTKEPKKNAIGVQSIVFSPIRQYQLATCDDPLLAPFGLSQFAQETRLNLDVEANDALKEFCSKVDAIAREVVEKHKLFPDKLATQKTALNDRGFVKLKVDTDFIKVYQMTNEGPRIANMELLKTRNIRVAPIVSLTKVWANRKEFGVTMLVKSVLVFEKEQTEDAVPFILA